MNEFTGHITITPHAKSRFIERRLKLNTSVNCENVYRKMLGMIRRSRLMKYVKKEDGRTHEYREYAGCIFVCERKFSRDFLRPDEVTVITVEMTYGAIMNAASKGININSLCLNSYVSDKVSNALN